MFLPRLLVVLIAFTALGAGPASAAAPDISVLGAGVSFKTAAGKDSKASAITVLNPGPEDVTATVAYEASDASGITLNAPGTVTLRPGATRIRVTFTGLRHLPRRVVSGQIVVRGGASPAVTGVTITPARDPSVNWPKIFLIGSGIVFALLLIIAWISSAALLKSGAPAAHWAMLKAPAPGPDWEPTGWVSTLTAVGALLGTVMAAITFPDVPREIDKDTLIQMNLAFGALLVIGPFMFQAIRRRRVPKAWDIGAPIGKELDKEGLWGWKGLLIVSYAMTGVAVFGQLGALTLLGWELTRGSQFVAITIVVIACLLAVLAAFYFEAMVEAQVRENWLKKRQDEKQKEDSPDEEPLKAKHLPLDVHEKGVRVKPTVAEGSP